MDYSLLFAVELNPAYKSLESGTKSGSSKSGDSDELRNCKNISINQQCKNRDGRGF